MVSRRGFLTGALAAGMAPGLTWADLGSPAFLSAARDGDGAFALYGLSPEGRRLFRMPLLARGHSGAAHPVRPHALAFARRPGNFAMVADCLTGRVEAQLTAPEGRHFYGHGAFSRDGDRFFTTENDYEAARGVIGVWDSASYRRIAEFDSGGIGPHEILRLPETDILAVANGGIETHPETGRQKLNLPTMEPNLSYLSMEGAVLEQWALDPALHKNSIRHLAVTASGLVGCAMQWQGDPAETPPLLGLHRVGTGPIQLITAPEGPHRALQGYAGSVAISDESHQVAITSPRGNVMQRFDTRDAAFLGAVEGTDICGLGANGTGFVVTSGQGFVAQANEDGLHTLAEHPVNWDNHLIPIGLG